MITPFVGGGFGGKSAGGQAVEAARLAQITGRPVQVAWTREEEFFYDTFDPAAVVKIVSGLDAERKLSFWDCVVYASGERGAVAVLRLPEHAHEAVRRGRPRRHAPVRDGAVARAGCEHERVRDRVPDGHHGARGRHRSRGVPASPLVEPQDAQGAASRRRCVRLEGRPRVRPGRGYGVACSIDAGTCVATMAEVSVDAASGKVKVVRIVCAQDMGIVVNPTGAKMQIEGGLSMGLGYALSEELRFRSGEILDRNFDTYRITRFSDAPRIEAVLVKNDDLAPQGGGEPSITTTGAVIANAVADATGVRMFRLPLTPARVLQALAQVTG